MRWIVTKFFRPTIQHGCLDHCENQLFHCCNVAFGLAANRRKIIGGMSQRISCVTPNRSPYGLKGFSFFWSGRRTLVLRMPSRETRLHKPALSRVSVSRGVPQSRPVSRIELPGSADHRTLRNARKLLSTNVSVGSVIDPEHTTECISRNTSWL